MYLHDHCRIGSLEKQKEEAPKVLTDHCRIGSLEMVLYLQMALFD